MRLTFDTQLVIVIVIAICCLLFVSCYCFFLFADWQWCSMSPAKWLAEGAGNVLRNVCRLRCEKPHTLFAHTHTLTHTIDDNRHCSWIFKFLLLFSVIHSAGYNWKAPFSGESSRRSLTHFKITPFPASSAERLENSRENTENSENRLTHSIYRCARKGLEVASVWHFRSPWLPSQYWDRRPELWRL